MNLLRLLALSALSVLALVAHGAGPHLSLPAIGSLDGLGVNIHFTDPQPGELEMIKAAGFKWVRMDLTWGSTERKRGEYDFSAHDRLAAALEKQGMHAVFILDYGNPLYAESGEKQPFTSRAGTEEFRAAYAKWAAAAVAHFAGRGYLFELWNEPNNEGFWKPKVNAEQYAALANAACIEIEKVAPKEALIGPATSTIDSAFIETCFKAGLLEHWCAVSVHPYRQQAPETVEEEYRKLRLLILKYAPKGKAIPILSGEWGYSTGYPAFAGKTPAEQEEMQAEYLSRMFLTNIVNEVPLSIWYDWRDDGDNPNEPEHRFGIVRRAFRLDAQPFEPKPAYFAAKNLTITRSELSFAQKRTRAIRVLPMAIVGDQLPVRVENSFGDEFHGTLRLADDRPPDLRPGERLEPRVPLIQVDFHGGEGEKTIVIPLRHSDGPEQIGRLILNDGEGRRIGSSAFHHRALGEEWGSLRFWSDGDAKVRASQRCEVTAPIAGLPVQPAAAARISYGTEAGWKFFNLSPTRAQDQEVPGKPAAFALWVHGDAKGCQARIRFIDAAGQTFQADGPKIDFTDWCFVKFPMQSTPEHKLSHWGGANDGVIHYPIKWDSVFLLDNVSRQPVEGEIYLSASTLIY